MKPSTVVFILASLFVGGAVYAKVIKCEKIVHLENRGSRLVTKIRVETGEGRNEVAFMNGEIIGSSDDDLSQDDDKNSQGNDDTSLDKTEKIYMPNVTCKPVVGTTDDREFNCANNNPNGLIVRIEGHLEKTQDRLKNLVVLRTGPDDRVEPYRFHISQCAVE